MCATSSDHRACLLRRRGFTLVELIAVLMVVGAMAVVAMPRLDGATNLRGAAWRDQAQAAVQHARSLAVGHRRLVCLSVATGGLQLQMASANPASSCNTALPGADGNVNWASDPQRLVTTASPSAVLYFQTDGRITTDGAGASPANFTISVVGEPNLVVNGSTGHVQ